MRPEPETRSTAIPLVTLPGGEQVPALGMSTYRMGEDPARRAEEILALRTGVDLGMTVIDTAELHGGGQAEQLVGEAIGNRRDEVFLVSKVLPFNASASGVVEACARSLRRLRTDRIDLYMLHWRGLPALSDTLQGLLDMQAAGMIRYWGVCNFELGDMRELVGMGGGGVAATQLMHSMAHREAEWDLIPWCRERRIPVMAYAPFDRGRLLEHPVVLSIAQRLVLSPAQVVLAWTLFQQQLIVLPTAHQAVHVKRNRAAAGLKLESEDRARLAEAFPPPRGPIALSVF